MTCPDRDAAYSTPYATESVECDRCQGDGEYEDDLWVVVRCYACHGTGYIEVCAACGDTGEECDVCGG